MKQENNPRYNPLYKCGGKIPRSQADRRNRVQKPVNYHERKIILASKDLNNATYYNISKLVSDEEFKSLESLKPSKFQQKVQKDIAGIYEEIFDEKISVYSTK